jgi:hypothetical protein
MQVGDFGGSHQAGGIFQRPVALSPNDLDLVPVATPALTHARSERSGRATHE